MKYSTSLDHMTVPEIKVIHCAGFDLSYTLFGGMLISYR